MSGMRTSSASQAPVSRPPVTREPTHAVFGFTGMLLKLFTQFKPHFVVVAVDVPFVLFAEIV